jgi:uncharacterized protein YceK
VGEGIHGCTSVVTDLLTHDGINGDHAGALQDVRRRHCRAVRQLGEDDALRTERH